MKGKNNFIFNPQDDAYTVSLKKNNLWWLLLLLLLLPLLLLIPFKKNITVETVDADNNLPVAKSDVNLIFVDYQLFNFQTKKFFTHDTIELYEQADTTGKAYFKDVKYTLYSRLLFAGKKAEISGQNDCYYGDSLYRFHKLKSNKIFRLAMTDRVYNYEFTVVNRENLQPIPDADVHIVAKHNEKTLTWDKKSAPDGTVYIENFPYCGEFTINTEAYGYLPDTLSGVCQYLYGDDSLRRIKLTPEKKMIQFFVKDLNTKDPLPYSTAHLIIDGDTVQTVVTNINGYATAPGEGEFSDVHILQDFTIHTEKPFYHDTTKSDNVAHWITLPDSSRTLYMRPEMQDIRFRDTDGSRGLAGVKNIIYVNGQPRPQPVYSDANGYFSVTGVSPTDKISIVASKPGYETNNYTIKNRQLQELVNGPQSKRDIPLRKHQQPTPPPPNPQPQPNPTPNPTPPPPNVQPCEAPQESGGQGVTTKVHSIGNSHRFTITWDMYNVPDELIVYCGTGSNKKKIFSTNGPVSGGGRASLYCAENYITIKIIGQQEGTQWKYQMKCN